MPVPRLEAARREGGEGLIAELVRVEKEGGRIASHRPLLRRRAAR
jgi:hypothetical protein